MINTARHLLARKALLPIGHLLDPSVSVGIETEWTGNYMAQSGNNRQNTKKASQTHNHPTHMKLFGHTYTHTHP